MKEVIDTPEGFDIRNGRAMVSLGPLSHKKYCSYSCPFCYVHADFASYPSLSPYEIMEFLKANSGSFDIVYVSGDTDSFAKPRMEMGVELVDMLSTLGVDVLFTTRAPLGQKELNQFEKINKRMNQQGNLLFGCISISTLKSALHLEPRPIPSAHERLRILEGLYDRGIVSVLAIRPFLPIVPPEEYVEIAKLGAPFSNVILGEAWYADQTGILEKGVFRNDYQKLEDFVEHKMDFDHNDAFWKVWEAEEPRKAVSTFCAEVGVPFYMRSRPAIEHMRKLHQK